MTADDSSQGGETVGIGIMYWEELPIGSLSLPMLGWDGTVLIHSGGRQRLRFREGMPKLVGDGEERDLKEERSQPVLPSQPPSTLLSETPLLWASISLSVKWKGTP